jgi:hypothetical protein
VQLLYYVETAKSLSGHNQREEEMCDRFTYRYSYIDSLAWGGGVDDDVTRFEGGR